MSHLPLHSPARTEEDGFAMITAMVLSMIAVLLLTTVVAQSIHLTRATSRERQKELALHVADGGVDRAIVNIRSIDTFSTRTETTPIGQVTYSLQVCTGPSAPVISCSQKGDYVIESQGQVGTVQPSKRRIRVVLSPEPAFKFAMFSADELTVKNNSNVAGDVWANRALVIDQNAVINGDVTSAGGSVYLGNSQVLHSLDDVARGGNVYSGGSNSLQANNTPSGDGSAWGVWLNNQTQIERLVEARRDCPAGATESPGGAAYSIGGTGQSVPTGRAYGSITANVTSRTTGVCIQRPGDKTLPVFNPDLILYAQVYGAANVHDYTPGNPRCPLASNRTAVQCFQAWADANQNSLTGVHYVSNPLLVPSPESPAADQQCGRPVSDPVPDVINLRQMTITGDFVLATNACITTDNNGNLSVIAPSTATVNIISTNKSNSLETPAMHLGNNLQITSTTPPALPVLLLYAKGAITVKNNFVGNGALYAGDLLGEGGVNNNLNITYDPRVERTLGFGATAFTQRSWQELPPI